MRRFCFSSLELLAILWMDENLHRFDTMRNLCLLVSIGESSFQGFLGGADGLHPR